MINIIDRDMTHSYRDHIERKTGRKKESEITDSRGKTLLKL